MKHWSRPCTFPAVLTVLFAALASPVSADLSDDIRASLESRTASRGDIGVQVIRLGDSAATSSVVFESNARKPLVPASNMKVLTTSAALRGLGEDFKFSTRLYLRDDQLIIAGDGDPTTGDAELLKKYGWTTTTMFEGWADLLKARGVTRVGNVVIDDRVFDTQFVNPAWPTDQLHKRYVAQVGGLNLNGNCLDFYITPGQRGSTVAYRLDPATTYAAIQNTCTSGARNAVWLSRELGGNKIVLKGETSAANDAPVSVTIDDPGLFFGTVLAETLRSRGITVAGKVCRSDEAGALEGATLLAAHETPIASVLERANKDSVNLYAECLLKRLAAKARGGGAGSWADGTTLLWAYLAEQGVEAGEVKLVDGSGLSRDNRVSANAITRVLMADYFGPARQSFIGTLAVGGVDGTLEGRFRDDLKGRVFAKTGYVSNARCLSGFLKTRKGNWYAFSILVNGPVGSEGKRIHEQIVAAIDRND